MMGDRTICSCRVPILLEMENGEVQDAQWNDYPAAGEHECGGLAECLFGLRYTKLDLKDGCYTATMCSEVYVTTGWDGDEYNGHCDLQDIKKAYFCMIRAGNSYPSGELSNFAAHEFFMDGVRCASMEGFLQSLKFSNLEVQEYVCSLVGIKAKNSGHKKNWRTSQTLYWRGVAYDRHGEEYQQLLDRAYDCLATNKRFAKALVSTRDHVLRHEINSTDTRLTILTQEEFCSRLTKIRKRLQEEQKHVVTGKARNSQGCENDLEATRPGGLQLRCETRNASDGSNPS